MSAAVVTLFRAVANQFTFLYDRFPSLEEALPVLPQYPMQEVLWMACPTAESRRSSPGCLQRLPGYCFESIAGTCPDWMGALVCAEAEMTMPERGQ